MVAGDDEYQFNDLEEEDIYAASEQKVIQSGENNQNATAKRMIWIAVGLLVTLFVGYKLFEVYFPSKVVTTAPVKPMMTPQPSVVPTQKPVISPPVSAMPDSSVISGLKDQVTTAISEQKDYTQRELMKVDGQVNELKNQITQMAAQISVLTQTVNKLVAENEKKIAPPPIVLPNVKKPIVFKPKRPVKAVPRERFYLQAVIPGRAWLKGENGTILTVSQGDVIPGYGKVQFINAQAGVVKTSSGGKIAFPPEER